LLRRILCQETGKIIIAKVASIYEISLFFLKNHKIMLDIAIKLSKFSMEYKVG